MPTPLEGDLPDQLLSDPKIQAESPQREIIATLESLTEKWRAYVPKNDAEEVALGVLLNSNAVQIDERGADKKPRSRLTITGLRWKALLENASDSERPKVVYMILKLAFESQQKPEPTIVAVEPPELIGLKQWLAIDGVKGHWQHTIAAAEFWQLEVDALHKDIAFLLRQVFGGDPSEGAIRDHLFKVHGLLPSNTISLANLEELLRKDALQNRRVNSATPLETFISDTRLDLDELLNLGEQTIADGTVNLPLSAPRADGTTSTTVRLFAESKASSIYKAFLRRLRGFNEELSIKFETENAGKLKTASELSLAIRRLLLEIQRPESQDRQSEKQIELVVPLSAKTEMPKSDSSTESDDSLPKKKRKDSLSRVKARAAHDYAMERIPNAQDMTIAELHAAILTDPEVARMVPARADAFGTYLREAGVKRYKLNS
ncbi:MAG: hypothetical protein ACK5OC_12280 [Pirellula sp.]|jgi:hypothetical protein